MHESRLKPWQVKVSQFEDCVADAVFARLMVVKSLRDCAKDNVSTDY